MSDIDQKDFLEIMQKVMYDFKEGGRLRDKEGRRIAKRTAQIVRWSSVGMVLLGAAFLALLLILTKDLVLITSNIVAMSKYTQSMSEDMHSMVGTMGSIEEDMTGMKKTIIHLGVKTGEMSNSIEKMNTSIAVLPVMNSNVEKMSQDLTALNSQVARMSYLMGTIAKDTNHMSKPMRMLPWN
jgi:uncharacterized protein YoxC